MFRSQNDNEGVVLFNEGPSILISDEQDKILEELLADYATEVNATAEENNNVESKKSMHRDIERQRRQEMSLLYASLRSLLPLEYVKGKRAVSDHMHQAVNYIKNMQKKIGEMRIKRDELNKLSNNVSETREDRVIIEAANSSPTFCVKINLCINGGIFEILISSSIIDKGSFSPSKVFDKLLQRGLNVISFVSTRVDKLFLHKIQIQENDFTSNIDLTKLEEELVNVMKRV
ncbi:hypothetical protein ABFS82_06G119500 [Erythranthe guttata]|uniref:transcription factor bHLH36-like n=1 Tax=Erythranthe guttata TaxID=4155 RepID=UPI00064DE65C|nr:PREDICTED: transcription factor bHLH36-like [Erythranthe guttata]|eukprot:XP_012839881.1 PREDICTED: transcription factor bHLH36-like [Erythranthe guttata]